MQGDQAVERTQQEEGGGGPNATADNDNTSRGGVGKCEARSLQWPPLVYDRINVT
jgi:hypothetical protein